METKRLTNYEDKLRGTRFDIRMLSINSSWEKGKLILTIPLNLSMEDRETLNIYVKDKFKGDYEVSHFPTTAEFSVEIIDPKERLNYYTKLKEDGNNI